MCERKDVNVLGGKRRGRRHDAMDENLFGEFVELFGEMKFEVGHT